MKILSIPGSALPQLAFQVLTPAASVMLDDALAPKPGAFIAANFWDITHKLQGILHDLPLASIGSHQDLDIQQSILGTTELLMHKLSALHESLIANVNILASNQGSRSIRRLRQELDAVVNGQFKIPINLVKHESHTLQWLDAIAEPEQISGFVVSGPIDRGIMGPANYATKPKAVAEGYSFPKLLRDALSSVYAMCDIAESTLWKAGALEPLSPIESRWNERDRQKVAELLSALNQLPYRCFPNENGTMVSEFALVDDSVIEPRQWKLHQFLRCRFSYTLPRTEQGMSYKMPYWVDHTK